MSMLDERWQAHVQQMQAFTENGVRARRDALELKARAGDVEAALAFAKLPPFEVELAQTRKAAGFLDERLNEDFRQYRQPVVDLVKRIIPGFEALIEKHLAAVHAIAAEVAVPMRFTEDSATVWLRRQIESINHACTQPLTGWTTVPEFLPGIIQRNDESND